MKAVPTRTDLSYLIGWFKVETKGKHGPAKRKAYEFLGKPLPFEDKSTKLENWMRKFIMKLEDKSLRELAEIYNGLDPETPVKKFSDKKSAIRRVEALLAERKPGTKERAQAISDSWNDPDVKAKRSTRHNVRVTQNMVTTEYRSVKQAFEEMGLPLSKHIKFRAELKAAGKLEAYDAQWEAIEV